MNAALRNGIVAAALFAPVAAANPGQEYKIIANASTDARAFTRVEISQLFMKKSLKWPDGSYVVPVDLPVGSPVRDAFSRGVHGKTTAAVDAYWQKQVFAGRDLPPITKSSEAEVVAYVRNTPGAVGYVAAVTETVGLRTIKVQ
jgi:ABC-type phosphate transport system substrate-binding protein